MPRRDTRERLIQAAAELMIQKGYQAAGVDEVCRLAEAQKGSFYHFFPAKADVAVAALAFLWSELRQGVFEACEGRGEPGLDRLRCLVEAVDAFHRRQWTERQVLGSPIGGIGQEMAGRDERIRAAVQEIFEAQGEYVSRRLAEAASVRQIPAGDHRRRARDIIALIEGALLQSRVAGHPDAFTDACASIPLLAGRLPVPSRPGAAVAPELA